MLAVAEDVLTADGFDEFTMTAVAERAGVSVGAIYRRVGGKEQLLAAVKDRLLSQLEEDLAERLHSADLSLDRPLLARGHSDAAIRPSAQRHGHRLSFSRRLRTWLLLAIALPLTRALVHRLALAAGRRDPSTRTAKALHQADSAVTAVSRRTARRAERRKAER
jgi:AcrR family transcriptional regulator